jgi:hypothetical protein
MPLQVGTNGTSTPDDLDLGELRLGGRLGEAISQEMASAMMASRAASSSIWLLAW